MRFFGLPIERELRLSSLKSNHQCPCKCETFSPPGALACCWKASRWRDSSVSAVCPGGIARRAPPGAQVLRSSRVGMPAEAEMKFMEGRFVVRWPAARAHASATERRRRPSVTAETGAHPDRAGESDVVSVSVSGSMASSPLAVGGVASPAPCCKYCPVSLSIHRILH